MAKCWSCRAYIRSQQPGDASRSKYRRGNGPEYRCAGSSVRATQYVKNAKGYEYPKKGNSLTWTPSSRSDDLLLRASSKGLLMWTPLNRTDCILTTPLNRVPNSLVKGHPHPPKRGEPLSCWSSLLRGVLKTT